MSDEHTLSLGAWMRRRRAELDLTQRLLAERAGCSVQSIRAFERGERRPSRAVAERLAVALELSPDERARFVRLARRPGVLACPAGWALGRGAAPCPPPLPAHNAVIGRRRT